MRAGNQPPSGGCVLKQKHDDRLSKTRYSAAFGRLRVETCSHKKSPEKGHHQPPSGGCVLKPHIYCFIILIKFQPPSGGCVLKRLVVLNRYSI